MAGAKEVNTDVLSLRKQLKDLEAEVQNQAALEAEAAMASEEKILEYKIASLKKFQSIRDAAEEAAAKRIAALHLLTTEEDLKAKQDAIDKKYQQEVNAAKKAAQASAAKSGKTLSKQELAKIDAEYAAKAAKEKKFQEDKFKKDKKYAEKISKEEQRLKQREKTKEDGAALASGLLGSGNTPSQRMEALKAAFTNENGETDLNKGLGAMTSALSDIAKKMESDIDAIGKNKTIIDTNLQGSKNKKFMGSYWDAISKDYMKVAGASALVRQSDVVEKLKALVGEGISYNVEQRAFLDTISAKIATTFKATDSALLRLVRIQQQDTTAARLGMESALTAFLNNMYETTEYMQSEAATIRQSINEASALMSATQATEFEYQVQKWMGSLYSVGFNSTSNLASALGKLAAGDISGITDGGYGNLLVMAANKANLSIADILSKGLDNSDTNKLLESMVAYLGQIYGETKGSNLLAQQYASVFGLTASDLKAAANLSTSINSITNNNLSYGGMITQLNNMADSMYSRTSMGELLGNVWENFQYTMAAGIASNPILYATYKIAGLLDSTVGGIALPMISVMGNTVDLHTTVADLMRVAAMSGGILSGIGSIVSGLASGTASGSGMLKILGINSGITTVARGNGGGLLTTSGASTSSSGYVGNSEGGDVQNKTMQDASDDSDKQLAEAQEESNEKTMNDVDESLIKIYTLLQDVTSGAQSFKVDMGNEAAWTSVLRTTGGN